MLASALQSRALPSNPTIHGSDEARAAVALVTRMVHGDVDAVAELYDRHSRLLFGLVLRIIDDRSEAEDVLQEVFLAAWNKAASYDASLGSVAGWLVRIARNRAIDRLRARSSRGQHATAGEAAAPVAVAAESPETDILHLEQQRAVTQALGALPTEQRALIEHAYYDGLSHSQLAVRFKLPLGTVKTRIRAGMMALRQQLQDNRVWS